MPVLTSAVVQIFATDVRRSIEFYHLLRLAVPEPGAPTRTSTSSSPTGTGCPSTPRRPSPACIRNGRLATPPAGSRSRSASARPAEVDEMFERLTGAGHPGPLPPYDAPWGQRYATVLDPDGNFVDLFAPLSA